MQVAGSEYTAMRIIAMRERNASIAGDAAGSRDTRYHLERHTIFHERFDFLAAAAENERVAALEPQYTLTFFCQPRQ